MTELFSSAAAEYSADGMILRSAGVRYVVWAILFVVLAGPALWCWWKRVGVRLAMIVGLTSLAIPLIVLPGLATERIEIGPKTMVVTTGFWFRPTQHTLAVEGLLAITERTEVVRQRGGERTFRSWVFHYGSNFTRSLRLSDMLYANRATVLEFFRKRGIEVSGA